MGGGYLAGTLRNKIKGGKWTVVRFFIVSVGYTIVWMAISSEVGFYKALYGPQILLQLNIAYFLPSIPLLVISSLLDEQLDRRFGTGVTILVRLLLSMLGCVVLCACFPLLPKSTLVLLAAVSVLGVASSISFSVSYQMVASFANKNTISLGLGCVGSGIFVLFIEVALHAAPLSSALHFQLLFYLCAGLSLCGMAAALSLILQHWAAIEVAGTSALPVHVTQTGQSRVDRDLKTPLLADHAPTDAPTAPEEEDHNTRQSQASEYLQTLEEDVTDPDMHNSNESEAPESHPLARSRFTSIGSEAADTEAVAAAPGDVARSTAPLQPEPSLTTNLAAWGRRMSAASLRRMTSNKMLNFAALDSFQSISDGTASLAVSEEALPPRVRFSFVHPAQAGAESGRVERERLDFGGAAAMCMEAGVLAPLVTAQSCGPGQWGSLRGSFKEPVLSQPLWGSPGASAAEAPTQAVTAHACSAPPRPQDAEASDGAATVEVGVQGGPKAAPAAAAAAGASPQGWGDVVLVIWPAMLALTLSGSTVLLIFPFFTYVPSSGLLGTSLPQVLFFVKLTADVLGRFGPRVGKMAVHSPGLLLMLSSAEVLLAPPFFFYILQTSAAWHHDVLIMGYISIVWCLCGFINTNACVMAPRIVPPHLKAGAAGMMAITYQLAHCFGLAIATIMSYAFFGGAGVV